LGGAFGAGASYADTNVVNIFSNTGGQTIASTLALGGGNSANSYQGGITNMVYLGGGTLTVGAITNANSSTFTQYTNQIVWNGGTIQAASTAGGFLTNMANTLVQVGSNGAFFDINGYMNTISANLSSTSGAGGLTITNSSLPNGSSPAVLTLAGTNSYNGPTVVNGGLLDFAVTSAFYNGNSNLWTTSNLIVNGTGGIAFGVTNFTADQIQNLITTYIGTPGQGLSAGSTFGYDVTGTNYTLTNSGSYTNASGNLLGLASVATGGSGTLSLSAPITAASITGNSTLYLASNTLTLTPTTTALYSGWIYGNGGLVMNGTGTQILTGTGNTYTGGTLVNSGTLQIGNLSTYGSVGTGTVTIASGASLFIDMVGSAGTTLNNAITGAGSVSVVNSNLNAFTSAGGTYLSGSNSFTGGLTVLAGSLNIGNDYNLGVGNGTLTLNGGGILLANNVTLGAARTIVLGTNGGFIDNNNARTLTINSQITGQGGLTVAFDGGNTILSGTNSYTGATTIGASSNVPYAWNNSSSAATLTLGNRSALTNGSALLFGSTFNGTKNTATLNLAGYNASVGALTASTNAVITNSASTTSILTIAPAGNSLFAGSVNGGTTGGISLVMNGTGTETLTGSNFFGGILTVNNGTIVDGSTYGLGGAVLSGTNGILFGTNVTAPVVGGLTGSWVF
jgi:autotransporter-associated beta strand protein